MTENLKPYKNNDWYTKWYNRLTKINTAIDNDTNPELREADMRHIEAEMAQMGEFPRIVEGVYGEHALVRKEYHAAVKHFTAAIAATAQSGMPGMSGWSNYYMRGRAQAALDNPAAALADYNHVIDVMSKEVAIFELHEVFLARSRAHHNLGNYPAAVADLEQAVERNGAYQSILFKIERGLEEGRYNLGPELED